MIKENLLKIKGELPESVELVAVSKFQPIDVVMEAYDAGQRVFGESRPQELAQKYAEMPKDIEWHFIGHLQSNKIKMIIPFVRMIHSIDSWRLAQAVSEQAEKMGRVADVLLQVYIAQEQTKQGFSPAEIDDIFDQGRLSALTGIKVVGLMGMATFTENQAQVRGEFETLASLCKKHNLPTLSMGMSQDYHLAIDCGSNMVRIGSTIFGTRNY